VIVITGGAGFIGSALIKHFNDLGRKDIIVVDRLQSGERWLNLRGLKFYEFIHADEFLTAEILDDLEVDAIYHMGACSDTTETNVDFLMFNNVDYSKALIEFATLNSIPICYASSAATYGAGEFGYSDDHKNLEKLKPLNPYGYSKQLCDVWMLKQKATPPQWYGVKFFNVFGPNEYHKAKMSSVVFQAFHQIQKSGEVKLFKSYKEGIKDGEQMRDFVYVKDVCRAMVAMMDKKVTSGIYNLGTGRARSFKDLVTATFKAMNIEPKIHFIEMPENLKNQYQYYTEANMQKFKTALPDFQFMDLEAAVGDYIKNHLNHSDPYLNS
jgi:ADP-L-glycero-D-manno-heptose 6-epimerase